MNGGFAKARYKREYYYPIHTKGSIFKATDGYSHLPTACASVYNFSTEKCCSEAPFENMKVIIPGELL